MKVHTKSSLTQNFTLRGLPWIPEQIWLVPGEDSIQGRIHLRWIDLSGCIQKYKEKKMAHIFRISITIVTGIKFKQNSFEQAKCNTETVYEIV